MCGGVRFRCVWWGEVQVCACWSDLLNCPCDAHSMVLYAVLWHEVVTWCYGLLL